MNQKCRCMRQKGTGADVHMLSLSVAGWRMRGYVTIKKKKKKKKKSVESVSLGDMRHAWERPPLLAGIYVLGLP